MQIDQLSLLSLTMSSLTRFDMQLGSGRFQSQRITGLPIKPCLIKLEKSIKKKELWCIESLKKIISINFKSKFNHNKRKEKINYKIKCDFHYKKKSNSPIRNSINKKTNWPGYLLFHLLWTHCLSFFYPLSFLVIFFF